MRANIKKIVFHSIPGKNIEDILLFKNEPNYLGWRYCLQGNLPYDVKTLEKIYAACGGAEKIIMNYNDNYPDAEQLTEEQISQMYYDVAKYNAELGLLSIPVKIKRISEKNIYIGSEIEYEPYAIILPTLNDILKDGSSYFAKDTISNHEFGDFYQLDVYFSDKPNLLINENLEKALEFAKMQINEYNCKIEKYFEKHKFDNDYILRHKSIKWLDNDPRVKPSCCKSRRFI